MPEQLETLDVVIVDDNPQFAKVLSMTLKGHFGFSSVRTIETLDEAMESFRVADTGNEKSYLFFVDYHFPNSRHGTEFLEFIMKNKALESSIAFLITSEPTVEKLKEAMKVGALGVIAKPFNRSDIEAQLSKARRVLEQRGVVSF